MLYADMPGLPESMRQMGQFATNPHADAAFWQPAPLLTRLGSEGKTFAG